MDLTLLGIKLKEDPLTYRREYLEELYALETLLNVPIPPIKQIKPILTFVTTNCHVDAAKSVELLVSALRTIKDMKIRRSVLAGLVIVRQKGYIKSRELFENVLMYGCDLTQYLRGCQEYLDMECYELLVEWYRKGTEKQKSFCYYFLLILFSRVTEKDGCSSSCGECDCCDSDCNTNCNDISNNTNGNAITNNTSSNTKASAFKNDLETIICEAFFGCDKITKICMFYFLNRTEIKFDISGISNGVEYAKRVYKELTERQMDRDVKIMKLKIFVLFKKHFDIRCSITMIILKMVDLEKPDLGELFDCLVNSVERREAEEVYKILNDEFLNGNKEDDIVCYGFNVMREVYYRLAGLEKEKALVIGDDCESDGSDSCESDISDEYNCENDSNSCDKDYICENGTNNYKANKDPFLDNLKNTILASISDFKGNRTRSIHFAYKALLKAVVKNETIDKSTTFVLKRKTREEREEMRKKGTEERKRELAREHRERKQKRSRQGRMKNKKNKLLKPSKKRRTS